MEGEFKFKEVKTKHQRSFLKYIKKLPLNPISNTKKVVPFMVSATTYDEFPSRVIYHVEPTDLDVIYNGLPSADINLYFADKEHLEIEYPIGFFINLYFSPRSK